MVFTKQKSRSFIYVTYLSVSARLRRSNIITLITGNFLFSLIWDVLAERCHEILIFNLQNSTLRKTIENVFHILLQVNVRNTVYQILKMMLQITSIADNIKQKVH